MKDSRQGRDAIAVTWLSPGMSRASAVWTRAHVVPCSASLTAAVRGIAAWCSQQDAVIDRSRKPQG